MMCLALFGANPGQSAIYLFKPHFWNEFFLPATPFHDENLRSAFRLRNFGVLVSISKGSVRSGGDMAAPIANITVQYIPGMTKVAFGARLAIADSGHSRAGATILNFQSA
jgi:hypothetical protein